MGKTRQGDAHQKFAAATAAAGTRIRIDPILEGEGSDMESPRASQGAGAGPEPRTPSDSPVKKQVKTDMYEDVLKKFPKMDTDDQQKVHSIVVSRYSGTMSKSDCFGKLQTLVHLAGICNLLIMLND